MTIKYIAGEEDYLSAMARIDELWGIPPDAPEADELDTLLALTGAYEKERYRIPAPDPEAVLEYRMDQMGLTEEQRGRYLECRKRLPEILSRESGLSLDVVKGLEAPGLERPDNAAGAGG